MSEEKNGQFKIGLTVPIWVIIGACIAVAGNLTLLNFQQATTNEKIVELTLKVDRLIEMRNKSISISP